MIPSLYTATSLSYGFHPDQNASLHTDHISYYPLPSFHHEHRPIDSATLNVQAKRNGKADLYIPIHIAAGLLKQPPRATTYSQARRTTSTYMGLEPTMPLLFARPQHLSKRLVWSASTRAF